MQIKHRKLKWEGREASEHKKPVNELKEWIPLFVRYPWRLHNGGTNKYLDSIVRKALPTDAEYVKDRLDIPVCTATKQFHLFQHRDVFKALVNALKLYVSDIQDQEATLKITEHGQSMWLSFTLDNYQFDQPYQLPFRLEVSGLNTVKAGKALDVRLCWYEPDHNIRFPFGMLSSREVKFKKIKLKKAKAPDSDAFTQDINDFLQGHLDDIKGEKRSYKRWIAAEINQNTLAGWVDNVIDAKWGYQMAARIYQIAMNGHDIQVKEGKIVDMGLFADKPKETPKPSELNQNSSNPKFFEVIDQVPAQFAPVRNAFDVSLVLGWVLSRQTTIPKQLRWVDIPGLMEELVKMDDKLRFQFKDFHA